MLTLGDLVMTRFNFETHLFEHQADLTAHMSAVIDRRHVEIAGCVRGARRRQPLLIRFKQEKLHLGTDIERIPHRFRTSKRFFEYISRVADKRRSIRIINVADQASGFACGRLPRQNCECVEIGP